MTDNLLADIDQDFDENKNFLEELVGENKKFKTVDDLAKGKWFSDRHAESLERENAELRSDYLRMKEELDAGSKLDELLETLKAREIDPDNKPQNPPITPNQGLDESKVEQLVLNKIEETQRRQKEQNNFSEVQAKLKERFGNSYATFLRNQTQALGLTDEDVNALAKKSPNAFYKTFGLQEQNADENLFQAPPLSNQKTDQFKPKGGEKRNYAYYKKIRREDPELYNKLRVQMDQDAITMREKFYEP